MVRINSITKGVVKRDRAREGRDVQSRQLDQGPHGGQDDRGRRARRAAQARRHDHRGHVGQHRHGPRHRRRRQGLQVHLHDDRQAVEGESRRAEGVRRRGDRLPDQRRSRRSALVLLGVVAARAGSAELLEGEPVRQPVELGGALRADRARDLGADRRRDHAPRRRRRHRRHDRRASAGISRSRTRRSRCGASTPTDRCSRNTRRPASSTRTRSTRTSPKASAKTSCRRTSTSRHRSLREGDRQGRGDHDAAASRARKASSPATPPARRWPACCSCKRSLHGRRRRRRDLSRSRVALSRQDVQRRLDAREGLPREDAA